ncbi:Rdx family-domain-containing protein [Lasiosphaeris hirsuta]|uniref:Rdx family-domain-containing protein n=1 Tax=Lasiosphaeris hirsuta TaxID=260670 RepID=A0AA40A836_9PEZI|nr:Rdx family-domain-containing protein [Lasiosphaeris hirsuta]
MAENTGAVEQTNSLALLAPELPRVTIQFCTQCKWLLRAAYYAQELLSTFSTALGEVALQPSTGGIFVIEITAPSASLVGEPAPQLQRFTLWDRKIDGGFPETKELKRRVRDVIQPERNLGHVDREYGKGIESKPAEVMSAVVMSRDAPAASVPASAAAGAGETVTGDPCNLPAQDKCEDCNQV